MADAKRLGTIPQLVAASIAAYGERDALVDGDVRLSFRALGSHIQRAARALIASGIAPGDKVALWAPNAWEWAVAALSIHCVGAALVPINTRFKAREAAFVLKNSRARLLFTVTDFLDTDYLGLLRDAFPNLDRELPDLLECVVLRGRVPNAAQSFDAFLERAGRVSIAEAQTRANAVQPGDLCHILFTSGTTGAPKGVMLIHSAVVRAYTDWADIVGMREGDRYLLVYPLFHSAGLHSGLLSSLAKGATLIPHAVFDARGVMHRVAQERIAMLPGPPAIFQEMLSHPEREAYDLSSLRLSITGSASVPVELVRRMRDELGFTSVIQGYGLTEATGIATTCRPGDALETIATTAGRAMPGVEVKIVDTEEKECPRGEPGEIVLRGYNVMRGYLDNPEETARAINAEGWLATGDIGVMDEDNNISITDRLKDMFIVGGFNAYPAEIENLIQAHPDVAQVAVIGIPDERLGEVGAAFVIPEAQATPTPEELQQWCRKEMANYKVPRRFEIVPELPRNPSGKVLKYELRAGLRTQRHGSRGAPS